MWQINLFVNQISLTCSYHSSLLDYRTFWSQSVRWPEELQYHVS